MPPPGCSTRASLHVPNCRRAPCGSTATTCTSPPCPLVSCCLLGLHATSTDRPGIRCVKAAGHLANAANRSLWLHPNLPAIPQAATRRPALAATRCENNIVDGAHCRARLMTLDVTPLLRCPLWCRPVRRSRPALPPSSPAGRVCAQQLHPDQGGVPIPGAQPGLDLNQAAATLSWPIRV